MLKYIDPIGKKNHCMSYLTHVYGKFRNISHLHDLMSVKQSNSPVVQFLWPSIVETIRGFPVPPAVGC